MTGITQVVHYIITTPLISPFFLKNPSMFIPVCGLSQGLESREN